jgi:hypothetical protein
VPEKNFIWSARADKMDIQQFIVVLNARATRLWIRPNDDDNIVAVSIYTSQDGSYFSAWFSHWNNKGAVPSFYDKNFYDGVTAEQALLNLESYLFKQESMSAFYIKEGERIVDEIGFGD